MPGHSLFTRVIASLIISLLFAILFPNQIATAGTVWREGPAEFENGTMENVSLRPGMIALNENISVKNNWTQRLPGTPSPRLFPSLVYNINQRELVLFGGWDESFFYNDTWMFNSATKNWTSMNPTESPPARDAHAMAYDSSHGMVVLFGGEDEHGTYLNDTWTYNLSTNKWTNMNPVNAPSARYGHTMVYDDAHGVVVLFGGFNGYNIFSDTWSYNLTLNNWSRENTSTPPPARDFQAMTYDVAYKKIVLFGGIGDNGILGDTWTYDLNTRNWTDMNPQGTPNARKFSAMTYNIAHDEAVLFGGVDSSGIDYPDTWTYNLSSNEWTNMRPMTEPPARDQHAIVYDTTNQTIVLFGGADGSGNILGDFWTYDSVDNVWSTVDIPPTPSNRAGHTMAFDSVDGVVILFGGMNNRGTYFNDLWTYNLTFNKWTNMNPPSPPPARADHAMVYDCIHGQIILFGGFCNSGDLGDTWTYNLSLNQWMDMNPLTAPHARRGHGMVYDSEHGNVVLFGGLAGYTTSFNDTWTYNLSLNTWTIIYPPTAPPARGYDGMAYDNANDVVILFGGLINNDYCCNDTWAYKPITNEWVNMSPSISPVSRSTSNMAYDRIHGEIILFGGWANHETFGDTCSYDFTSNNWTIMTPSVSPLPRYVHSIVYDIRNDEFVLFGGYGNHSILSDTWTYNNDVYQNLGTYNSGYNDAGGTAYFGSISWNANVPLNTSILFQFRSADTQADLRTAKFLGPDGTTNTFYDIRGQRISSINNGTRWFQYRVYLFTNDITVSPVLTAVTIDYNLLHSIKVLSPVGGENWTDIQNITWSANDIDNDSLSFDIFLNNATISIPLALNLPNGTTNLTWNSSLVPNGTYYIRVVAKDNNLSIPLSVSSISGDFSVYHLKPPQPPNHLPHIWLLSPLNNSIVNTPSIRLAWLGTDPDYDPLTYTVYYSNQPFSNGNINYSVTTLEYLDMTNLTDNSKYYWTIDANDGINNQTDVMAEIWSFTVDLPHQLVNHPPRITSLPPTQVMVGDELYYNMTAFDEDGDALYYSLVNGPQNMSIDSSSGRIQWMPSANDVGDHTVVVQVSDGRGSVDVQTFTVTVIPRPIPPAPEKPQCTIIYPLNGSKVGGRIIVRGTAVNGSSPLTIIQVRIDGGDWLTAIGLKNWTLSVNLGQMKNGGHTIEARAFDGSLYSDIASVEFTVANPEPSVSSGGSPWCLPGIIVAVVAGMGVLLVLGRKKGALK